MAYIGKALVGILNENKVVDSMTGDGSDTTLTLSRTPGSVNNVEVFIDGIYQTPDVEYTLAGDTITFTSAPELNVNVVAVSGADSTIINPAAGSITGAKIVDNAITGAKVAALSASKLTGALPALSGSGLTGLPAANLTGALPALDGSALTGLPAANLTGALPAIDGSALTGVSGVTKSASDPAIDTNPSGGLGQLFLNTTSGEMYACTDATTDANVWTNVGPGDGDIALWSFTSGATVSVYHLGGTTGPAAGMTENSKITVSSDTAVNGISNLAVGANDPAGSCSETHGYAAGRMTGATGNTVERIAFSNDTVVADVGDLITKAYYTGSGGSSQTHGYVLQTRADSHPDMSQKYTFASSITASNIIPSPRGNSPDSERYDFTAASSDLHIYVAGGYHNQSAPAVSIDSINRMAIASETSYSEHGNLQRARAGQDTSSSTPTDGYLHGGYTYDNGGNDAQIDKWSFANNVTATDIGDLQSAANGRASSASTTHGYSMQGGGTGPVITAADKFNYAGAFSCTSIAGLTMAKRSGASCHD